MSLRFLFVALLVALTAGHARAQTVGARVIRLATIAPDGTSWTREAKAFSREVEEETHGDVTVRWFFGGVAGDELAALDRIRRGQLDGEAGAVFCDRVAPSMRVLRATGLYADVSEWTFVLRRLKPILDQEFAKQGFANLGATSVGMVIVFSRMPVRNIADLRRGRLYIWKLDDVLGAQLPQLGMHTVPIPLEQAALAYEQQQTDGFITFSTAALALQWSAQAKYFTDIPIGYVPICLTVANRALDPLPHEHRRAIEAASARLLLRLRDINDAQEGALLNGLFEHQGVHRVPASQIFRRQYLDVSQGTSLPETIVPRALLDHVRKLIAEYRAGSQLGSQP